MFPRTCWALISGMPSRSFVLLRRRCLQDLSDADLEAEAAKEAPAGCGRDPGCLILCL